MPLVISPFLSPIQSFPLTVLWSGHAASLHSLYKRSLLMSEGVLFICRTESEEEMKPPDSQRDGEVGNIQQWLLERGWG